MDHVRDPRFTAAPDHVEINSRQVGPVAQSDSSKSMARVSIDADEFLPHANQLPPNWEMESC